MQPTDIAIIKVDADGLVDMPIGDSESVRVGDFVLAIGNPFGLSHTVTSGIVSALGRTGISRDGYEDFIQTDASINPGNSGGALVNLRGELVGINSAIISRTGGNVGIGFAVPTEIANSIMRQILDFGEVRRGLLGVSIAPVDAEVAKALNASVTRGALITRVEPGSAAEDAGLQVDDIIVQVNEKEITNHADLRNTIGLMRSGDEVDIEYVRGDDRRTATTALGQQLAAASIGSDIHPGARGRTVRRECHYDVEWGQRRRSYAGRARQPGRPAWPASRRHHHAGESPASADARRAQRDMRRQQPYPVPARRAR